MIENIFYSKDVLKIGVYGYGKVGTTLCSLLQYSGIEISFLIDRNAEEISTKYNTPIFVAFDDDLLGRADAIVVTPLYSYNLIKSEIKKHFPEVRIVTIENIINDFVEWEYENNYI